MRNVPGGQILCSACITAWQSYQPPFAAIPPRGPNPALAAFLGLIPGVGAFYNSQFVKGFIHVAIFAVLVAMADHYGVFGLFIAAWVIYQSFEAYHTAKAMRDDQPLPDPLGLNEAGSWMNQGARTQNPAQPGYQPPTQAQYQAPYAPPADGVVDPNAPPPIPPMPSLYWRRREPIGAIILIGLGIMFLLGQLDLFHGRLWEFFWPVALIGLGVWMIVRRFNDSQGGLK
jgi:TM2 domain-containing membrane protein YozV